MNNAIFILLVSYAVMSAIAVKANAMEIDTDAHTCELRLQGDISVSNTEISVSNDAGDRLTIMDGNSLSINDQTVTLDSETSQVVSDYSEQIRTTVPEIVAIALEGVEVGLTAVTEVFYTFSQTGPPASLLEVINGIQEEVTQDIYQHNNEVFLRGGAIQGLEPTMEKLEPALEDAVAEAMGDIIVSAGTALKEGEGSFLERIASMAQSMQQFERNMEQKLEPRVRELEKRAEGLCTEVYALRAAESKLHVALPQTRAFKLVKDS
ncbi:MAG: DUF2884 family protein [Proteobacteria bacterium]|nr:DUF2884 family protein [Pseudomonadota bacterium]